jgi:hypothetical protein
MQKSKQTFELPEIKIEESDIILIGDSALISHKWSEKAKKEIRDKQQKKAKTKKEAKNPEQEYEDSLYRIGNNGQCGFPAIAFKAAAVNACSHVEGITKVTARGAFHVTGEIIPIYGKPEMREDMVRLQGTIADLRYRGQFPKWYTVVHIRYNSSVISLEQIANLFNTAGFAIGVGEWRPQKNGNYGMFHVGTKEEIEAMQM